MSNDYNPDTPWGIKLKNGMYVTENKLFEAMKRIGLNPQPQYQISDMRVDFAFLDEMIAIEINGKYHQSPEQIKRDKRRWFVLNREGWKRRTFTAKSVHDNPDLIARKIAKLLGREIIPIKSEKKIIPRKAEKCELYDEVAGYNDYLKGEQKCSRYRKSPLNENDKRYSSYGRFMSPASCDPDKKRRKL